MSRWCHLPVNSSPSPFLWRLWKAPLNETLGNLTGALKVCTDVQVVPLFFHYQKATPPYFSYNEIIPHIFFSLYGLNWCIFYTRSLWTWTRSVRNVPTFFSLDLRLSVCPPEPFAHEKTSWIRSWKVKLLLPCGKNNGLSRPCFTPGDILSRVFRMSRQ